MERELHYDRHCTAASTTDCIYMCISLPPPPSPHLGVVGPQHQPATKEEGDVEDSGADDEAQHGGEGEPERDEQHVVLVKVAEEAQDHWAKTARPRMMEVMSTVAMDVTCQGRGERGQGGRGEGDRGRVIGMNSVPLSW